MLFKNGLSENFATHCTQDTERRQTKQKYHKYKIPMVLFIVIISQLNNVLNLISTFLLQRQDIISVHTQF